MLFRALKSFRFNKIIENGKPFRFEFSTFSFKRPRMYEINRLEAVDIDEEEDFRLAELLFRMRAGEFVS